MQPLELDNTENYFVWIMRFTTSTLHWGLNLGSISSQLLEVETGKFSGRTQVRFAGRRSLVARTLEVSMRIIIPEICNTLVILQSMLFMSFFHVYFS